MFRFRVLRILFVLYLMTLILPASLSSTSAQDDDRLQIVSPDAWNFTYDDDTLTDEKTVTVYNPSGTIETLRFCIVAPKIDEICGTSETDDVTADIVLIQLSDSSIEERQVSTFALRLSFAHIDNAKNINGVLVVRAADMSTDVLPAFMTIKISSRSKFEVFGVEIFNSGQQVVGYLVFGTALIALAICVLLVLFHRNDLWTITKSLKWDAKESWATSITAVGALLGSVVVGTTSILPANAKYLDAKNFQALNMLFLLTLGIAPFVYNGIKKNVLLFIVAGSITCWAVLGELATIELFLIELDLKGLNLYQGVLAVVWIIALIYIPRTISKSLSTVTKEQGKRHLRVTHLGYLVQMFNSETSGSGRGVTMTTEFDDNFLERIIHIISFKDDNEPPTPLNDPDFTVPLKIIFESIFEGVNMMRQYLVAPADEANAIQTLRQDIKTGLDHTLTLLKEQNVPWTDALKHLDAHAVHALRKALGTQAPIIGLPGGPTTWSFPGLPDDSVTTFSTPQIPDSLLPPLKPEITTDYQSLP